MAEVNPQNIPAKIIVHEIGHALAALTAAHAHNRSLVILSATGAVRSAGAGWWRELVMQAGDSNPDQNAEWILDCADEPGMALAALREGVGTVALDADEPVWSRVAQIADQHDARVIRVDRSGALDLAGSNNPQRDCDLYLSKGPDGVAKPGALG
ncbi:MAG: hypothetical protein O3B37_04360 [Proteobacteria bacterium]|nr:hypothetical protein [Pseudomonadota bacterium]